MLLGATFSGWIILVFFLFFKKNNNGYLYPLTSHLLRKGFSSGKYKNLILKILKSIMVLSLVILSGRPQLVDILSKQQFDGIAIMLSLDVSKSMELIDDRFNPKQRIDVAKKEAINFIQKRVNDEIGFVIFGSEFLTISLTTLDKKYLETAVEKIKIGLVDGNSTALGKGLAGAVLRIKDVVAKSRIIILLTDGKSTTPGDVPISKAIEMAKEFGIKVYSIGIGCSMPFAPNVFGQLVQIRDDQGNFDETVLKKISLETGGKYFHAKNPKDMKLIYEVIDKLETSKQDANIFEKCYDIFWPFLIIIFICLACELFLKLFLWKTLS